MIRKNNDLSLNQDDQRAGHHLIRFSHFFYLKWRELSIGNAVDCCVIGHLAPVKKKQLYNQHSTVHQCKRLKKEQIGTFQHDSHAQASHYTSLADLTLTELVPVRILTCNINHW